MRELLVSAILVCAASAQVPQWVTCPLNGHQYALLPPASWAQSEQFAVQVGGHLATVRNASEHAWIVQTFCSGFPNDARIWIGLTDQAAEGVWAWTSGEPLAYTNWGPFQPDNAGGNQNAGGLWNLGGAWAWDDDQAANGHASIIELSPPAASYAQFGASCAGAGLTPVLEGVLAEPPRLGTTTRMRVTNLPLAVTVPIFVLGLSNTIASGGAPYPLPLELGVLGWPGCSQLVSMDSTNFTITTSGQADYSLVVPSSPTLPGFTFYAQVLVLYHPTGAATTNGLIGIVGS